LKALLYQMSFTSAAIRISLEQQILKDDSEYDAHVCRNNISIV